MAKILDKSVSKAGWAPQTGVAAFHAHTGECRRYEGSQLKVFHGEAELVAEPELGAAGPLDFVVKWSKGAFVSAEFSLKAFDEAIPGCGDEPAEAKPDGGAERELGGDCREARVRICSGTSHFGGMWIGAAGTKIVTIPLPAGRQVTAVLVEVQGATAVVMNPAQVVGATGEAKVIVSWSYPPFGWVTFRVCVDTAPATASVDLGPLTIEPNPVAPGGTAKGVIAITNDGAAPLADVRGIVQATALELQAVPQWYLDSLSEEERTVTLLDDEVPGVISPGSTVSPDWTFEVPAKLEPNGVSSKGTYRVRVSFFTACGSFLGQSRPVEVVVES